MAGVVSSAYDAASRQMYKWEDSPMGERVATLAAQLAALADTVASEVRHLRADYEAMASEQKRTRERLHKIEADSAAVRYSREALTQAREAREQTFTRRQKRVAVALAIITTATSVTGAVVAIVVAFG